MKSAGPLVHTLAGTWLPWLALAAILLLTGRPVTPDARTATLAVFIIGFAYTQFFEYVYHRFVMHQLRWAVFNGFQLAHTDHHKAFPRSRFFVKPERLLTESFSRHDGSRTRMNDMIAQRWWIYPMLFGIHVAAGAPFVAPEALCMFLCGTAAHYSVFELAHWYTHVHPTRVDIFLRAVPVVGRIWSFTVDFHRTHHTFPQTDFNFTPPFLGDRVGGTFRNP
ncbi:MAG TPA: hypothetical protein VD862_03385 [Candidatus Paceibacterota bacterium]|nr:hypothetical protein [Candidatus Paceibacterota bacterium]